MIRRSLLGMEQTPGITHSWRYDDISFEFKGTASEGTFFVNHSHDQLPLLLLWICQYELVTITDNGL